jgi:dTDP-4-dehydrorhamnose 3,5-epimerase
MEVIYWKSKKSFDLRGFFSKIATENSVIANTNFNFELKDFFITSSEANVIRGMHLQTKNFASNRIIHVISGEINDVLVDLKTNNRFNLINEKLGPDSDFDTVFVPAGIAHGYESLSDSEIIYLSDAPYSKNYDTGFNPLSIDFNWLTKSPIISERDRELPSFKDFIS